MAISGDRWECDTLGLSVAPPLTKTAPAYRANSAGDRVYRGALLRGKATGSR